MSGVYRPAARIAETRGLMRRRVVFGAPEPQVETQQVAQSVTWATVRFDATFTADRPTATLTTGRPSATWSKQ